MKGRIYPLTELVANQIAAGEVIERPASVVKELLENALDAGADQIQIQLQYGGLNQIQISDNGSGIFADDLILAVTSHATSKIRQLDDLFSIDSMGFRGEALASIAAVARVTIQSKPQAQAHAMMLQVEGQTRRLMPCARDYGTTIDVCDLFFNAPVRKKFLKSDMMEYQAVEAVVKRFAMAAPHIAIQLKHNQKIMLELPRAMDERARQLRLKKLFGKTFFDHAVEIDVERGGLRLVGFMSNGQYHRSQNDKQWLYLNQRMVKDKLLNQAIKQSYAHMMPPGRFPAYVFYLTVPLHEVDINVHPTKHEVRFQQPRLVHDFITSQLQQVLGCVQPSHRQHLAKESVPFQATFPPASFTQDVGTTASRWIILNEQFILKFIHNQPFVVDMQKIFDAYYTQTLASLSLPWPRRALLVPVKLTLTARMLRQVEDCIPWLATYGFEVNVLGETTLLIRTLPLCMPHIELMRLMQQVVMKAQCEQDMLPLLLACQTVHLSDVDCDMQQTIEDFMQQIDMTAYAFQLDVTTCRDLCHA